MRAAIRDYAGRWRRWESRETGDGWLFEGDGDSPVRVRREGAVWVLGSSSAVQATPGAAPAAVVLTGTPADILLLDAVASGLGVGQARAFVAWRCSSPLSCDGASATTGEIVGRGFEIIGTGSMIAGTLGYEVRRVEVPGADGRTAVLQRYWVGDGPLYSGEAFRIEGAGVGDWMRVR
ncbi:MAG: hypothetical protein O9284_15145 [Steroidobacteraceae bacterium]|nr:hypothetical protein [Steroidobacteraceae bacterium]